MKARKKFVTKSYLQIMSGDGNGTFDISSEIMNKEVRQYEKLG